MINIYQPSLGKEELNAIEKVFESNWIGRGPKTTEFEKLLSERIGCSEENLTTTTCCTEGIFQILDYLEIGEGDEVILPSISFIGIGNAILDRGAKPVFCDINKRTLNPDSEDVREKITNKTKALILIHYSGLPCEMEAISRVCKHANQKITIIEDNACSPFSEYNGKTTGTLADFGVWSFDAMKILVAGDCGLIYGKDKKAIATIKERSYLGLTSGSGYSNSVDKKWWEFDISYPGRRAIINDVTAAIGIEQLKKVDGFIETRKKCHDMYDEGLNDLEWLKTPPNFPTYIKSSYYMYWVQLETGEERDLLAKYLKEHGVYTTYRYYPLHWVKYYADDSVLENTDYAANNTLCLPLHQALSEEDVNYIIEKVRSFK